MLSKKAMIQGTPENIKARLDIAYDVLKLIEAKKVLVRRRRSYVVAPPSVLNLIRSNPLWDLKKVFTTAKEPCEVCALGAMFVADIKRNSNYSCSKTVERQAIYQVVYGEPEKEITQDDGAKERLANVFTHTELSDIESSFEGWNNSLSDLPEHFRFAEYSDAKLTYLMYNIIYNNGYFKCDNWPTSFYIPPVRTVKKPASKCLRQTK